MLLTEDVETSEGSYPNYSILFDLYMMAIMKPERIHGVVVESDRKMGDLTMLRILVNVWLTSEIFLLIYSVQLPGFTLDQPPVV